MRYRISGNQFSVRVRLGTERSDFFLVIDYYLAQEPVRALLDAADFNNYRWLERRDRAMRSINLFITGDAKQANELVHDVLSWDALEAAFKSKRGAYVLLVGMYVKLLILLRLYRIGNITLAYLKQVAHK
jgi:hypothetical protein